MRVVDDIPSLVMVKSTDKHFIIRPYQNARAVLWGGFNWLPFHILGFPCGSPASAQAGLVCPLAGIPKPPALRQAFPKASVAWAALALSVPV